MSLKSFRRKHLRAPLKTEFLFENEGHVFKGRTSNISEGGILLSSLPCIPKANLIHMMIDLPYIPELQGLQSKNILQLKKESFDRQIIRLSGRIVRSFEAESEVDQIFETNIGCQFLNLSDDVETSIRDYVSRCSRNTIYLLSLFEQVNVKASNLDFIRRVAYLLGYNESSKMATLRQKVLHDYHSLESL